MEERTIKKVYMMLIVQQNDLVDGVFVLLGSDAAEFVLVDYLNYQLLIYLPITNGYFFAKFTTAPPILPKTFIVKFKTASQLVQVQVEPRIWLG